MTHTVDARRRSRAVESAAGPQKVDEAMPTPFVELSPLEAAIAAALGYEFSPSGVRRTGIDALDDGPRDLIARAAKHVEASLPRAAALPKASGYREAVARIIDPPAWKIHDDLAALPDPVKGDVARKAVGMKSLAELVAPSLAKADEIIAILNLRIGEGWQTTDSAPRDGTVLLLGHSGAAFDGWWDANFEAWVDGSLDNDGELQTFRATHWMHLPALPEAASSFRQEGEGE